MKKLIYYILNCFSHNLEGKIVNLLKKEKKLVIFDVGCFRGYFTETIINQESKEGIQSNFYLFDPSPKVKNYLSSILAENGFEIEYEVSGVPTAWFATWSNGTNGPTIALGSDIDGIPKASQYPGVSYHKPIVEGAPIP